MIFYLFLGFLLYAVLLFVYVIIGNYLHGKQERESYDSTVELLDQITLVIPFRNESQRIQELLKSIKNSNSFPFEIIFVDDHSSDHGAIIIEKELQGINYRIIQMEEQEGKKYALRKAFAEVNNALVQNSTYAEEFARRKEQTDAATKAYGLSKARYDYGYTSYLEVLIQENSLFDAELQVSALYQQRLNAMVNLYRSLGGGWE